MKTFTMSILQCLPTIGRKASCTLGQSLSAIAFLLASFQSKEKCLIMRIAACSIFLGFKSSQRKKSVNYGDRNTTIPFCFLHAFDQFGAACTTADTVPCHLAACTAIVWFAIGCILLNIDVARGKGRVNTNRDDEAVYVPYGAVEGSDDDYSLSKLKNVDGNDIV